MSSECICLPLTDADGYEFNRFVGHYFHDCIYSPTDTIAFTIGWFSIILFFFALIPQIVINYRTKSVEGLSPFFLIIWLLGDIFNLLGCILSHQLLTQTLVAVYFCCIDAVTMYQLFYYSSDTSEAADVTHEDEETDEEIDTGLIGSPHIATVAARSISLLGFGVVTVYQLSTMAQSDSDTPLRSARALLSNEVVNVVECQHQPSMSEAESIIASFASWASGLLYFCSRIPQVRKNYLRKTCDGLSVLMFIIAISSNVSYGLSIILRLPPLDEHFFADTLPFLIGSIGTLVFDFMVLVQMFIYRNNHVPLRSGLHREDGYKSF